MEREKYVIDEQYYIDENAKPDESFLISINQNKKSNLKREIFDFIKVMVFAMLITNFLNVFVFSLSQVQQTSMETTLIAGDQLIVEKVSYNFGHPHRGDIIVFIKDSPVDNSIVSKFMRLYDDMAAKIAGKEGHYRYVKRVIGLPGDTIDIREGKIYINDSELSEKYLNQPTYAKLVEYPMIVPQGQYFVVGDNRQSSYDSRDFGCIQREQIEGKVAFRIWPFTKLGIII